MQKTVLVVEDDIALNRWLTSILQNLGFTVTVATTLTEAKHQLEQQNFHLVLSDVHLGLENAIPFIRSCQENQQHVIVLSSDDSLQTQFQNSGIDFFVKPISLNQVLSVARAL